MPLTESGNRNMLATCSEAGGSSGLDHRHRPCRLKVKATTELCARPMTISENDNEGNTNNIHTAQQQPPWPESLFTSWAFRIAHKANHSTKIVSEA